MIHANYRYDKEGNLIDRKGDWVNTFLGIQFWPLDPRPEEIDIRDIAHALSMQCRFTGHIKQFYSVAQHCLFVSEHCDPADALWGLLHDATEAYLVDLARPIKHDPSMSGYRVAEGALMIAICQRFGLEPIQPESVKIADHRTLVTEAEQLMAHIHPDWMKDWGWLGEAFPERLEPLTPKMAELTYLRRFAELSRRA